MTRGELQAKWDLQRNTFDRTGAMVNGSKIIAQFLADLASVEASEADRILTLREAAAMSGYSVDHLARLVRDGRLSNAGRLHSPRIRAADLPRRPKQFDGSTKCSYDVSTDARTLRSR